MKCAIERFIDGAWEVAATLTTGVPDQGHLGECEFEYDIQYALKYLDRPDARLACAYPVDFGHRRLNTWPAFLVDLLPQGAGRQRIVAAQGLARPDGSQNDWAVLRVGAGNPPGDLRIAEAHARYEVREHPGFSREEIVERNEGFAEYAAALGAPVAGSSGVQGEAPKFLLTVDRVGRWHADGALPDHKAQQHYLVKFPRGKGEDDRFILRTEASYYAVAREFGLHVGAPLAWENNALFIPRFDRAVHGDAVQRYGMESLYALAGLAGFGMAVTHDQLAHAIGEHSTDPIADLIEYVKRDILNVAMRNTDNHGRNSAMLKRDGEVRLSPLYDFAPMFLDDAMIARVCRWENDAEQAGMPVWGKVAERLERYGVEPRALRRELGDLAGPVRALPETMERCGVDRGLIERLSRRIENVADALAEASPG